MTLAVIAYNQEAYVRNAIDSALAQDYTNLQVILSDDGSSDETYAVMEAAAGSYKGPHQIALNRRLGGGGVLAHLQDAARLADGELFVGAAGDDMSLPHRVQRLVEHWRADRPAIIYSAWNRVDSEGRFLSRDGISGQHDRDLAAYFPDRQAMAAFGCTTAYSTAFIRSIPEPEHVIWTEDYFLSLAAMLTGDTIRYLDEALVCYRQNPHALRNYGSAKLDYLAYEEREIRFFDGLALMLWSLIDMIDRGLPPARTRVDRDAIIADIAWYRYRADWARRSFGERVRYTVSLRTRQRLRWAVPRLIGMDRFVRIKTALQAVRQSSATGR